MTISEIEDRARQLPDEMMAAGRQVWLAGLGVVGMAGNTTQAVFGMLVEEGRKYNPVDVHVIDRLVEETSEKMDKAARFVEQRVQATTKVALNKLGMPSRSDVEELTARVEQLQAKVEALGKRGLARAH